MKKLNENDIEESHNLLIGKCETRDQELLVYILKELRENRLEIQKTQDYIKWIFFILLFLVITILKTSLK